MPWSHIKTIALMLLLTVLAHDTVMAGNPHSASTHAHPDAGSLVEPGALDHAAMTASGPVAGGSGPVLLIADESPCGLVVALGPPSPPDVLPDRGTASPVRSLPAVEAPVAAPARRADPDHPPDVLRAFLQVFLN
jgi:hypothetical protein